MIEGDIHYQSLSVARGARMNGNCQYSQADLDIMVLSGKKPVKKAEDALAFGDAAMEAATIPKAAPKAKAAQ